MSQDFTEVHSERSGGSLFRAAHAAGETASFFDAVYGVVLSALGLAAISALIVYLVQQFTRLGPLDTVGGRLFA
jgi:hypothetical protein